MSEFLVLWLVTSSSGVEIVEAKGARIVRCSLSEVSSQTLASCDGVVAVVDDDRAATAALGAGVDEVIRQADLTEEELTRAGTRAAARAGARLRGLETGKPADEAEAMATLLDWVTIELVASLSGAVLEGELLEESVRRMLARSEVGLPAGESAPSAADTLEMLDTVRESFRLVREILHSVRTLSGSDGASGVLVGPICEAVARLIQNRAVPLAQIELELDPNCGTSLRAPKLVGALVSLMGDILERAARDAATGKRARITLRAFAAEGSAIVEVEDDLAAALERSALPGRPDAIVDVGARLRQEDGDLHVASAPGRTTVRLILPLVEVVAAPVLVEAPRRGAMSRAN